MSSSDDTGRKQTGAPQFKPGQSGNPNGRPKGSRNKLGEAFVADLYADWSEHGKAVIERVRNERPQDYLKVTASLLPREMKIETTNLSKLSDDELGRLIDIVRTATGSVGGTDGGTGSEEGGKPPPILPTIQ